MIRKELLAGLNDPTAKLLEAYVLDGGGEMAVEAACLIYGEEMNSLAENLWKLPVIDDEAELCARFLFAWSSVKQSSTFLFKWVGEREEEAIQLIARANPSPDLAAFANEALQNHSRLDWSMAKDGHEDSPFVSPFANLAWQNGELDQTCVWRPGLVEAFARWKPEILRAILSDPILGRRILQWRGHAALMKASDEFDHELVTLIEGALKENTISSMNTISSKDLVMDFFLLNELRENRWRERALELASSPLFSCDEPSVALLLKERPDEALALVRAGGHDHETWSAGEAYRELFLRAFEDFEGEGGVYLREVLAAGQFRYRLAKDILRLMLAKPDHPYADEVRQLLDGHAQSLRGKKQADFWELLAECDRGLFKNKWHEMLRAKGKQVRAIAASWVKEHEADTAEALGRSLLGSESIDERMGGVTLLCQLGRPELLELVAQRHAKEPSKQVRVEIAQLAAGLGISVASEPEKVVETVGSLGEFEENLKKKAKSIRMPKAPWLDVGKLPSLFSQTGEVLSELAVTYLFQLQARQKGGELADELAPLLPLLDRGKNAAFAKALLDQWFASDKKAPTRWALNVAGMTGDDSIISRLISPIPKWCEANQGSRAEWCAHAIALLGTDRAMQTLDALIQKYRNHRKYVSAAASDALRTLAEIQGISEDEMAERIVPDFGFNAKGERYFLAKSGEQITARLRADLKLVWQVEGGKEAGAIPKSLTSAGGKEAKDVKKFLTQGLKSQALRLERAMIEGRRWEIKVWRERFEVHPVFQCFAESQVWGVFDPQGLLKRTFRRYANGILADADGKLEEFDSKQMMIGLVHPLLLDVGVKDAWRAHLRRFKVKPAFVQMDRAIELLDPMHGNRRELRLAEGVEIDASGFRARALGRGWSMGSTQDGGYIYDCFRKYPGLGLEVYLRLEGFHASSGRGAKMKLGIGLFARPDPNQKRAYLGVMPGVDDSRVMSFAEVPAVVYSETVADLKAIVGEVKG